MAKEVVITVQRMVKNLIHQALSLKLGLIFIGSVALILIAVNFYIRKVASPYVYSDLSQIEPCYTGLVLGAFVQTSGYPSDILQERLDTAFDLYRANKITRFLLSGDHGRTNYDEVNNMKHYLIQKGVPEKDIFLDHAGFDTYDSIVRAKEIFEARDIIIITQEFHIYRAVYIARQKRLNAFGAIAHKYEYPLIQNLRFGFRDKLASIKAFLEVSFNTRPHFLGEKIPITGDSKLSYD